MTKNNQVLLQIRRSMADVDTFIETCSTISLREYQRGVARSHLQIRAGACRPVIRGHVPAPVRKKRTAGPAGNVPAVLLLFDGC